MVPAAFRGMTCAESGADSDITNSVFIITDLTHYGPDKYPRFPNLPTSIASRAFKTHVLCFLRSSCLQIVNHLLNCIHKTSVPEQPARSKSFLLQKHVVAA